MRLRTRPIVSMGMRQPWIVRSEQSRRLPRLEGGFASHFRSVLKGVAPEGARRISRPGRSPDGPARAHRGGCGTGPGGGLFRTMLGCLLVVTALSCPAQVWEKPVLDGVTYRMEVEPSLPRVIHALRIAAGAPGVSLRPELANGTVFEDDATGGRNTVSAMLAATGAIAGLNADFFPFTGDPLGTMVRDGVVVSRPDPRRASFGWGPNGAEAALIAWRATLASSRLPQAIELGGINEECGQNAIVANFPEAGQARAKGPSAYAVVRTGPVKLGPNSTITGTIESFFEGVDALPIQPGNVVLAARGAAVQRLKALQPGDQVELRLVMDGMNWEQARQVVGGGPFLVREAKPMIDWQAAGFQEGFATNRHPRSAIGVTETGDLWLVAVDGRQPMSRGVSLAELAQIMIRLGCVQAINLDGGGSTALGLWGAPLNRPSDGKEREVSNAVLLFGPPTMADETQRVIQGPPAVVVGQPMRYQLIGEDGKPVPLREVIWTAQGSAWVDQSGLLRPLAAGQSTLTAMTRGRSVSVTIEVLAAPVP